MDAVKWLEPVLLVMLILISSFELVLILRVTLLLRELVWQLREFKSENRTLLRNLMSVIQESSRGLGFEMRAELGSKESKSD